MKKLRQKRAERVSKKQRVRKGFAVMPALLLTAAFPQSVMASAGAGFSGATNALDTLKTGLFAIIAGVGVILIGKNIMEISTAFQQQDSASLNNGIKGLIAGILMAGVGGIVTALGF